jgi:hypothetical protein
MQLPSIVLGVELSTNPKSFPSPQFGWLFTIYSEYLIGHK